jgi:hypothetical protein
MYGSKSSALSISRYNERWRNFVAQAAPYAPHYASRFLWASITIDGNDGIN